MNKLKYYLRTIWHILRTGRRKTTKEELIDLAKKHGYTGGVYKVPKKYKGKKKYRKAPAIQKH